LIDWSYDLLTPEEQALFQWCSVFAGGWTLEAAEQVCSEGRRVKSEGRSEDASFHSSLFTIHTSDVLDLLAALVDKSLVIASVTEMPVRYHMLETLRHYAAEKLRENGSQDLVHERHCDLMVTLMSDLASRFHHNEQLECLARFDQELGNLRAA